MHCDDKQRGFLVSETDARLKNISFRQFNLGLRTNKLDKEFLQHLQLQSREQQQQRRRRQKQKQLPQHQRQQLHHSFLLKSGRSMNKSHNEHQWQEKLQQWQRQQLRAVVVVKWSVCLPSIPTIQVQILLTPTFFSVNLFFKRPKINKKRHGLANF